MHSLNPLRKICKKIDFLTHYWCVYNIYVFINTYMQFIITNPDRELESQNDSCKKKLDFPIPIALPVNMGMGNNIGANNIYSYENHINFYSIVDKWSALSLQREIRLTVNRLNDARKFAEDKGLSVTIPPIIIHINSPGGSLFDCMAIIDYMTQIKKSHPNIKFHSIIEGCAASAATLISVVCDHRSISEYAHMLIHQLSAGAWGKYHDIKEAVQNMDKLMVTITTIYTKHTKISQEKLNDILKHDIYWDAKTCLEHGLVDDVIYSA